MKAKDFFQDLSTTAVGPDEVLTEVRIPVPAAGTGMAYVKTPTRPPASRWSGWRR